MPTRPGRPIVLAIIAAALLISVATIALSNLATQTAFAPRPAIRFALTVVLCWYLYRGSPSARQLAMLLFALGGLSGLVSGGTLLSRTPFAALLVAQGVIYIACVAALWFVPSVRDYFRPLAAVGPAAQVGDGASGGPAVA